jgi:FixJ family two-component response regulator
MDVHIALITADPVTESACLTTLKPLSIPCTHYVDHGAFMQALARGWPAVVIVDTTCLEPSQQSAYIALQQLSLRLPVLLLTPDGAIDSAVLGIRWGARDCLEKGLISLQLAQRVNQLLA